MARISGPRIRSLKPEHTLSRKVGGLSDRAYRLWVSLICQADDEGRGSWDAEQFRCIAFAYQRRLRAPAIEQAMEKIVTAGLVYLYQPDGFGMLYQLHDWSDHQRVDNPAESKFPPTSDSSIFRARNREESRFHLPGSDRIGSEGSDLHTPPRLTPEELVEMYNTLTPDNCPAVKTLSPGRKAKCRKYLAMFPDASFWKEVFGQYHKSRFLAGLTAKVPGHEGFTPDFDWLLSRGRDGVENCVKVRDGKYRDG